MDHDLHSAYIGRIEKRNNGGALIRGIGKSLPDEVWFERPNVKSS